jgi:thiol:disulfide interchange protein DsbD
MKISLQAARHPTLLALLLLLTSTLGYAGLADAKPWWMRGSDGNDGGFLPPDVAFRPAAHLDGSVIRVRWVIADGYYLYRSKIAIRPESPDLVLAIATLPPGRPLNDPYLGAQDVFFQQAEASVPFSRFDGGAHPLQIKVTYQGCAEAGLCYPPITKVLFPTSSSSPERSSPSHPWEGIAIVGGSLAFLLAGLVLRKGRRLETPAS